MLRLQRLHGSISQAKEAYDISISSYSSGSAACSDQATGHARFASCGVQVNLQSSLSVVVEEHCRSNDVHCDEIAAAMQHLFSLLYEDQQATILGNLFVELTGRPVLRPFVRLSQIATKRLEAAGKGCDLVQRFAQCVALDRPNTSTPLMPLDRMPFGLIEYQLKFFTSPNVRQVRLGDEIVKYGNMEFVVLFFVVIIF